MDEISKLQHEIEGLRLQLASKEEVLERCLGEIDRLSEIVIHQEKLISGQRIGDGSKGNYQKLSQHRFNPGEGYGSNKKQEIKSNCKITMAAIASNK